MNEERAKEKHGLDWIEEPEEYFSDVFWTHVNPWSAAVTFGLRKTRIEDSDKMELRVRMPLQQAKALGVILLKTIRRYETEANVSIDLPKEVLKGLDIAPEDWGLFK